jgi:hypothetical protein
MGATNFHEELLRLVRGFTGQTDPSDPNPIEVTVIVQGPDPSSNPNPVVIQNNWKSILKTATNFGGGANLKSISVPANKEWQLMSLGFSFSSTADVGDRRLCLSLLTAGSARIADFPSGVVQPASQTYFYTYGIGQPLFTAAVGSRVLSPLSPAVLPAGTQITLLDINNVAGGDDTWNTIHMVVAERAVS